MSQRILIIQGHPDTEAEHFGHGQFRPASSEGPLGAGRGDHGDAGTGLSLVLSGAQREESGAEYSPFLRLSAGSNHIDRLGRRERETTCPVARADEEAGPARTLTGQATSDESGVVNQEGRRGWCRKSAVHGTRRRLRAGGRESPVPSGIPARSEAGAGLRSRCPPR